MDITLTKLIAALLVPPGLIIVLLLSGWLLARRHDLTGRFLAFSGFALLWLSSTPLVADFAIGLLETVPALTEADLRPPRAGAIVVLCGGRTPAAPEYGGRDVISRWTLERARYAAFLHRRTRLPILVSGGRVFGDARPPEAELLRETLENDFHVPVRWVEGNSRNSQENAVQSHRLLAAAGITRIYLVTHAWHMPRARRAFEQAGFTVIPAPTGYRHTLHYEDPFPLNLLPRRRAFETSAIFFREVLGLVWYAIRY